MDFSSRGRGGACALIGALLLGCGDAGPAAEEQDLVQYQQIQLLSVSDWHGQLDPMSIANVGNVGGAAVLSAYFEKEREANPNTVVLTAGDSFGATPPLSAFFADEPTILAMNAMGFAADGIGNHNWVQIPVCIVKSPRFTPLA